MRRTKLDKPPPGVIPVVTYKTLPEHILEGMPNGGRKCQPKEDRR